METFATAFLFTDIEGSTRLLAKDPAGYPLALERHRSCIRSEVETYGGDLISLEGDSSFTLFRSGSDAVRCAAAIQGRLRAENVGFRVRMGIHVGEARRTATGVVGLDIHRAARVADAAHGGQVVMSEEAARQSPLRTIDLGWHHLKDLATPLRLHQLDPGSDEVFPPLRTITGRTHHLPRPESSLVGRDDELARLSALLTESRMVTIVGPGGVGKTRLAITAAAEVARDFRDGVWFADLTTVSRPEDVLRCINLAIGVDVAGDQQAALARATRDRNMLIVVDNMEHVIEAANELAGAVTASPNMVLLVTSREVLRVGPERTLPLSPLGADAVTLFLERAVESGATIDPGTHDAVERICAMLEGLPLAIELASAAVRIIGVEGVLASLARGQEPPASNVRDAPSRHRRISDTIAWSHDLLTSDEQTVFRRMAIAPSPQPLTAIESVCPEVGDVTGIVTSLADKSLVVPRTSAALEPRLAMLDLVRRYAAERLERSGERERVSRLNAEYWARLSDTIEPGLWGADTDRIFRSLSDQVANLESALEWAFEHDPKLGAEIAGGFLYFLFRSSARGTATRWMDAAVAVDDLPAVVEARIWVAKGYWSWGTRSGLDHSHAWQRAVDAARRSNDERLIALADMNLAVTGVGVPDRYEWATAQAERAAAEARALGLPVLAAQGLNIVGELARNMGDLDRAQRAYEEVLSLIAPVGDLLRRRMILANLSFVASRRGDHREALRLGIATADSGIRAVANEETLIAVARPMLELGRPGSAAILHGAALADVDRLGTGWQPSDVSEVEALERRLGEELDQDEMARLIAAGRNLGSDEAVEFARAEAKELLGHPDAG